MATVELRFTPLPAHVRTARLVAVSLGRRAGLDDEVLDEVRLAVGEAATRAVGRHESSCPGEPVLVRLTDGDGQFVAEVVDRVAEPGPITLPASGDSPAAPAPAIPAPTDLVLVDDLGNPDSLDEELPPGVDLAVIGGLVDDVTVESGADGSVVRMVWPVTPAAGTSGSPNGADA